MCASISKQLVGIGLSGITGYVNAQESVIAFVPADWMLILCGTVIGVVIAVRRLNVPKP
jgi:hypothetical protein